MSDLLIEANPALLDGWCGPVLLNDGADPAIHLGTKHPRDGWAALGEVANHESGRPVVEPVQQLVSSLSLDLSRAEARDRVARVLFQAPAWVNLRGQTDRAPSTFLLSGGMGRVADSDPERCFGAIQHVPTLATLDPSDDTRLPDGSRRVDALALAMVWREVSDA